MHGGGSAESLYQHLKVLDRTRFEPLVLFVNHSRYFEKISALGISCEICSDRLYNRRFNEEHPACVRWAWRFRAAISRYIPWATLISEWLLHHLAIRQITNWIGKQNIDLVHTNNQVDRDLYAIEAARRKGIPCVAHLRSHNSHGLNYRKADFINCHVDQIIAYSKSVAHDWSDVGVDHQKMTIIHNAIEPLSVQEMDLAERFGISPHYQTVGIVGRIIPARGHFFLLEAFAGALESNPDTRLLIVGDGEPEYVQQLKRRVAELALLSQVVFTGYCQDSHGLIASLDALVLPYNIEPFGRTLLEAWQLRTPVVLTRIGHIRDIVQDRQTGVLVNNNDVVQLSNALVEILTNQSLRNSLVEEGYQHCRKNFSMEGYVEKINHIYDSLLCRRELSC